MKGGKITYRSDNLVLFLYSGKINHMTKTRLLGKVVPQLGTRLQDDKGKTATRFCGDGDELSQLSIGCNPLHYGATSTEHSAREAVA